jgi:arylsulfatase
LKRPNILLLYTDQHRWDALGCNGNAEIHTPSIDALAAGGVTFTRHFAQHPLCMPSRASRLTGQYPSRLGITEMGAPVPQDAITLPRMLKPYGYFSANLGKLHFLPHANRDHREAHPDYGFDQLEVSDEPGPYEDAYRAWVRRRAPEYLDVISTGLPPAAHVFLETMNLRDPVRHPSGPGPRDDFSGAIPFPAPDDLTHSAFVAQRTIDFLNTRTADSAPFLCIAGFYSPHAPWIVPQRFLDLYERERLSVPQYPAEVDARRPVDAHERFSDAQLRSAKHGYYAMISEVDFHVGRIVNTLRERGLGNDTLIVFTADHGEWLGDHLRFGKGYPGDDATTRVPLVMHGPGCSSGLAQDAIVESVDLVPTLLALAAIQPLPHLQGRSLAVDLRGEATPDDDASCALFEAHGWRGIRSVRFRYVIHSDGRELLWDLEADPGEYVSVAQEPAYAGALADCRKRMLRKILGIERPLPRVWPY